MTFPLAARRKQGQQQISPLRCEMTNKRTARCSGGGIDFDALVCAAGVFDMQRVEVVLLGEFVELGVVGVVELVPGHGEFL